jgi:hypothetical protein
MILLAGIPSEPPLKLVCDAAIAAKIPFVLFNQREAHNDELSFQCVRNHFSGFIRIRGEEYPLDRFQGVYVRMMDYSFLPEIKNRVFNYVGDTLAQKSITVHQQLLNWLDVAPCRVLNRPADMFSNFSKPYQSQLIARAGFRIPSTCVTSDERAVARFRTKYPRLIFKSISSARSIVRELGLIESKRLSKIRYLPTQFQEKLDGVNIRVHVVGEEVFATKAVSEVVDYRYAGRENANVELIPFRLPAAVRKRCILLSKAMHLPLCGIDLFLTKKGEYFCFEVNPSPGYSYYQEHTGQDIASAIVTYLEKGTAA